MQTHIAPNPKIRQRVRSGCTQLRNWVKSFFQNVVRNGKRLRSGLVGLVVGQAIYLVSKGLFPDATSGILEFLESTSVELRFYSLLKPDEPI